MLSHGINKSHLTIVSCRIVNASTSYLEKYFTVSPILLVYTLHSSSNCIRSRKNANYQESHTAKLGEGPDSKPGLKIIHCLHIFTRSNYQATLVSGRTRCLASHQQGICRGWRAWPSYHRGWTKARVSFTIVSEQDFVQIIFKACPCGALNWYLSDGITPKMSTEKRGALRTFLRWYAMSKSMGKSLRQGDWWKEKFSTRKNFGSSSSNCIGVLLSSYLPSALLIPNCTWYL